MKQFFVALMAVCALGITAHAADPVEPQQDEQFAPAAEVHGTDSANVMDTDNFVEPGHGGFGGGHVGGGHVGGGHPGGGGFHPAPGHPGGGYHPAPVHGPGHPGNPGHPGYPGHPGNPGHPGYPGHPGGWHPYPGHPDWHPGYPGWYPGHGWWPHPFPWRPYPVILYPPYYAGWEYECSARDEFGRLYSDTRVFDPHDLLIDVINQCETQSGGACTAVECHHYVY